MNAIQIQSVIIAAAALTQGVKGVKTATVWGNALKDGLSEFPIVAKQIDSWIACGASTASTSGIAYKSVHNKGIFPVEQIFCNSRPKAKRPISQIGLAIAKCLIEGVDYNPDRFSSTLSIAGLEQGLTQFNIDPKRVEKAVISQQLAGLKLNKAEKSQIVKANEELIASVDSGSLHSGSEFKREHTAKALETSALIDSLIAKYSKLATAKPATAKPATAKPATAKKA